LAIEAGRIRYGFALRNPCSCGLVTVLITYNRINVERKDEGDSRTGTQLKEMKDILDPDQHLL
jgi:hypothetical protein